MGYYEYDTGYYEESIADEILNETKEKLKAIINSDIKSEMEQLKTENMNLKEQLKTYKSKENELRNRELEIERKENQDINKMYKSKWSETLEPLTSNFIAWRIGDKRVKYPKCNKCNYARRIVYTSEFGDTIEKFCKCNDTYIEYFPDETVMKEINLSKDRYSWGSAKFFMKPKYDSKNYDDSYSKLEFERYMDEFNLEEIKKEKLSDYDLRYEIVYTNKKACQDCCDYLNGQRNLSNYSNEDDEDID